VTQLPLKRSIKPLPQPPVHVVVVAEQSVAVPETRVYPSKAELQVLAADIAPNPVAHVMQAPPTNEADVELHAQHEDDVAVPAGVAIALEVIVIAIPAAAAVAAAVWAAFGVQTNDPEVQPVLILANAVA